MNIKQIEAIPLQMRYRPGLEECILRSGLRANRGRITLYRAELDGGAVGYGDFNGDPNDLSRYVGQNAVSALKQVRHSGLQMALFDAVGHALDLPAHELMGRKVRDKVPLAYWTCDLGPEEWAEQARLASQLGYRVYKFKCRPWWDPIEQVETVSRAVPAGFTFWLDFNGHLREVRQALPVLAALSRYDCIGGFESPIPQRDVNGYRVLRAKIDRPIAAHYGSGCCHVRSDPTYDRGVPVMTQINQGLCDGLVLGSGDVHTVLERAAVADEAKLPFWIQTIGTGLRAAWVLHLASVCRQATLSSLAAHTIWEFDASDMPAPVAGFAEVPEGSGLGVGIDEEVVKVLKNAELMEIDRWITSVVHPDGVRWYFASEQQRHEAYYYGNVPGFVRGSRLDVRHDDGSSDFDNLYKRCEAAPVLTGP